MQYEDVSCAPNIPRIMKIFEIWIPNSETGFVAVYANVWMNLGNIPNRKIERRQRQIGRSIVCSGLCHKFTFWGKLSEIPDLAINSHFAAKLDLWFHIGGREALTIQDFYDKDRIFKCKHLFSILGFSHDSVKKDFCVDE